MFWVAFLAALEPARARPAACLLITSAIVAQTFSADIQHFLPSRPRSVLSAVQRPPAAGRGRAAGELAPRERQPGAPFAHPHGRERVHQ